MGGLGWITWLLGSRTSDAVVGLLLSQSGLSSACPGLPVLLAQPHSAQHGLVLVWEAQLQRAWEC